VGQKEEFQAEIRVIKEELASVKGELALVKKTRSSMKD
jgi:hypothetical protein